MNAVVADLIYRLIGSAVGASIALVRTPPKSRAWAFRRAAAGLLCGMVFSGYVGRWLSFTEDAGGVIAAASITAFISWQATGAVKRGADRVIQTVADRFQSRSEE